MNGRALDSPASGVASPTPGMAITTFLFTDIEGSTRLWEQDPERMRLAQARHDALLRSAVETHDGRVVKMIGDGMHAAFEDPLAAVRAAATIQRALAQPAATSGVALRVRGGLHVGDVECRDNDYFGVVVNRAARIMSAAHGGQVLLSQAVFDRVRERLPAPLSVRDLGSVRLKDLATAEHVYQLLHPDLREDFPALRSLEATPNNLPQRISSFVGREQDLVAIRRFLGQGRLVTLVGSGGIGKTRASLQVAADALDACADGVWLIELGPLADAGLVPSAAAQVLGIETRAGVPILDAICRNLESRRLLLVLDNCEHLIDACAELVTALLTRTPDVRILASSREPLHVQGEQVVWLPPLSLPDPGGGAVSALRAEAVQLFVERVRLQRPDFVPAERQVATIAELCVHLDGIPLALELAAALVPVLSVEEISARLGDRFRLLTRGSSTALPHQQTLRATLDWSYEHLGSGERRALNRLAIFPGGFTLEASSAIIADDATDEFAAVDLLSQLVTRSLVIADPIPAGTRYRLLETTRAYALGRLDETGERAAIARRHAHYVRDLFRRAPDDWLRMSDAEWRAAYLPERDNLRAALDWASGATGDADLAIALAGSSGPVWPELSLQGEGQSRLEAAIARFQPTTPELDRARVWHWLGLAWGLATPAKAVPALEHAIELYRRLGDAPELGWALARLGHELAVMGRSEEATVVLAEAFGRLREADLPKALGDCHDFSAVAKSMRNDPMGARADLEFALANYRRVGAERYATYTLVQLADIDWSLGELDAAVARMREAAERLRTLPHTKVMLGFCLTNLAGVHVERGEYDEALTVAREGLPLLKDAGYAWINLDELALRLALVGKLADAARLAGFADATIARKKEAFRQTNEARARQRLERLLMAGLASQERERLLAEGARLGEEDAYRLALQQEESGSDSNFRSGNRA
jgi:predicted ATPase/class 3 adenylate cyclase